MGSAKDFIVGIVFFIMMIMLGVTTIVTGNIRLIPPATVMRVQFDRVSGLQKGNKVRVAGLDVGVVKKIGLDPVTRKVQTTLEFDETIQIFPGYEVVVKPISPLGGRFVHLYRGDATKSAEEIDLKSTVLDGTSEDELTDSLGQLGKTVRDVIAENRQSLKNILGSIDRITGQVAEGRGTVGRLIFDEDLYARVMRIADNLQTATDNLARISTRIERGEGNLGKLVHDEALYANLVSATGSLDQAMQRIESIATKADEGAGTIGALVNDRALYEHADRTAANLAVITGRLADGEGTIGKLLTEDGLYDDLAATAGSVRSIVGKIDRGDGTIGKLINDSAIYDEAKEVMVTLRESMEDLREQAPVNTFIGTLFSAF